MKFNTDILCNRVSLSNNVILVYIANVCAYVMMAYQIDTVTADRPSNPFIYIAYQAIRMALTSKE